MLHTKFRGNRPAGSGEDIQRVFTVCWHQIFISLYLKAFIQNLVQIGKVVYEKILFEFLYVHNLWPRSRNDLDLQYSHDFIYSFR